MEELNDAQKLINIIMRDLGFSRLIELSNYFQISNGSFHGWLKRNSVRTILKYCKKYGIDEGDLNYKLQNYDSYMSTPISLFGTKKEEPVKFSDRFKQHMQDNPPSKTLDKIQKLLEVQNQHAPCSSPYSSLFQILFGLSKDEILRILSEKLELENASDEDKIRFIEDFEALLQHIVSSQAKLEILDRVRKKV